MKGNGGEGGKGEPHPGVDIKNSMETPSRPKGQRAISQPDVDITAIFCSIQFLPVDVSSIPPEYPKGKSAARR